MTSRLNERESRYNLMLSAIFRWFNRSDSFVFGKTSNPDMVSACEWLKNRL